MNQHTSIKAKLREYERALSQLRKQRRRRSISERSVVLNWTEVAEVLGMSRMSIWRDRQEFPPPLLPAFKTTITDWAEKYCLPRKRGPLPKGK